MEVVKIQKSDLRFDTFLRKANEAYLARSNEQVQYVPILDSDITDAEQIFILLSILSKDTNAPRK